jgi:hypothetical protein
MGRIPKLPNYLSVTPSEPPNPANAETPKPGSHSARTLSAETRRKQLEHDRLQGRLCSKLSTIAHRTTRVDESVAEVGVEVQGVLLLRSSYSNLRCAAPRSDWPSGQNAAMSWRITEYSTWHTILLVRLDYTKAKPADRSFPRWSKRPS